MDLEYDRQDAEQPRELIAGHTTSAEVADVVIESLEKIAATLSPIVGTGGVVALFSRSVQMAGGRHPWLCGDAEPSSLPLDLVALRQTLADHSIPEATAGGTDLLRTFRTLLATLIGASLTEQLLRPAWNLFPRETAGGMASR